jgi:hypothetical protein
MRRVSILLSLIAVAGLCVVVGIQRPSVRAQEATPASLAAMAAHPVVGGWRFSNEFAGATFPSLAIVHADGTYTEVLPDNSLLIGVWQPIGERTATLTVYNHYLIDDKLVKGEGRFTLEVDQTGTTMMENGTFVGLYENGSIDVAAESRSTGTRLNVLPVEPLGTPVIPTDMAAAGTPTP